MAVYGDNHEILHQETVTLKAGETKEKEESGSSSYVPREPEKDTQLQAAIKHLLAAPADGTSAN